LVNRNIARYTEVKNHGQTIDGKNLLHLIRSLKMCNNYVDTKIMDIDRSNIDRDFLLSIRKGEMNLESIITLGKNLICELEKKSLPLPKQNLKDEVEQKIIKIREDFYK